MIDLKFMEADLEVHWSPAQRAAYRAGMSTAAAICDAVCAAITDDGRRKSKSKEAMAELAKKCGDEIWKAREKVRAEEKVRL
jgi:hypothetical protein